MAYEYECLCPGPPTIDHCHLCRLYNEKRRKEKEGIPLMTAEKANNIRHIVGQVLDEVMRATSMYKPLNSPHEAHSVIEEEFDEFWDEVKAYNLRKGRDTRPRMREELIQLAAMAVRAVTDVIDNARPEGETIGLPQRVPSQDTPTVG